MRQGREQKELCRSRKLVESFNLSFRLSKFLLYGLVKLNKDFWVFLTVLRDESKTLISTFDDL